MQRLLCVGAGVLALFFVGWPVHQAGASCLFSDLRWSADGASLRFVAGPIADVRTLVYELASGRIQCLDPRAQEPRWSASEQRILFRDQFGVFALHAVPGEAAVLAVFLPEESSQFVRDFGADASGRVLVWLFDRHTFDHIIVALDAAGNVEQRRVLDATRALEAWTNENHAVPFENAARLFVRSTCIARPHRLDRLCLEKVTGVDDPRAQYRLTLGPPGGVDVLMTACAPSLMTAAPDSARVVVSVFENVSSDNSSRVLSAWVSDWTGATRVYRSSLGSGYDVRQRQSGWVHWRSNRQLLWADAVGQLVAVDTADNKAEILLDRRPNERRALHRIVAAQTSDRSQAERWRDELRGAGFDAGVQRLEGTYEVQAGAASTRDAALERADAVRERGFRDARVVAGSSSELALEMAYDWVIGPAQQVAFIRNVLGREGMFSEVWLDDGTARERLVGSFENYTP